MFRGNECMYILYNYYILYTLVYTNACVYIYYMSIYTYIYVYIYIYIIQESKDV